MQQRLLNVLRFTTTTFTQAIVFFHPSCHLCKNDVIGNVYPGPQLPSDDHIRVLILEPGELGSPVHCQLVATTIYSAPSYEALSYTWGDPEQCTAIKVRDTSADLYSEYAVTLNCFAALNRLRYKDRSRTMWIDAICIDQSTIPERSHQVTLMSEIYSKATQVIVYLGEAEADSDLAMDYILDIDAAASSSSLTYSKSDTLAHAVNDLFQRPWFNRIWVVQEIVFASYATVLCGSKTLSWSSIQNFRSWAAMTAWIHELPFVVSVSVQGAIEEDSLWPSDPLTVLEQLDRARHCRATDPRDKIYAQLPFLRANEFNKTSVPDYTKSVTQVFTECAARLVVQSGLDILCAVQSLSKDESLPSWVPDWSVPPMRSELGKDCWFQRASQAPAGDPDLHQVRVLGDDDYSTLAAAHGVENTHVHNSRKPVLQAFAHCNGHITHLGAPYIAGQGSFPIHEWLAVFT